MRRLVIYSFYDAQGVVDRYVLFMLENLQTICEHIVIVCNGKLTPESRDLLKQYTSDVLVRENKGYDIWGYKTGLDFIGWNKLRTFDEVVLLNDTLMGPVYPFAEMFSKMAENDKLDFWGMTKHCSIATDPFKCNPFGYIPEHIQSSFMVFRKKFLLTRELKEYWDNLPELNSYEEAIGKHESFFTKHFSDMGFRWDTYVKNSEEEKFTDYYLLLAPKKAIQIDKCPCFKRRTFFQNQDYYLNHTMGESPRELFKYLQEHTNYDTSMIWENLIRSCNQYDFVRTLGLFYILPTEYQFGNSPNSSKVALVIHLYYLDLLSETLHYASAMPDNADIYITTPHKDAINSIKKEFSILPNKVEVRLIENRGRDVSSFLVGAADLINKYEFICFYHDKKVTQVKPFSVGRSFSYLASESALQGKMYVENIIKIFNDNKYLGMLTNIPPYHNQYYDTLGCEWGPNFGRTKKLLSELDVNVPLSKLKPPIAPLGTVFWFRTKAIRKLFKKNWKYTDFPPEPNGIDGTLLHAFERAYSYVIQDAGYYPAYVLPDSLASLNLNNFIYYLREFNLGFQQYKFFGEHLYKKVLLKQICEKERDKKYRVGGYIIPLTELPVGLKMLRILKILLKGILPGFVYYLILKIKRSILGPKDLPLDINS